jgi:4-hydroxy-tetrahydrodipicolinate synthase
MSKELWKYQESSPEVSAKLFEQLKGVTVAMVAPLNECGNLDTDSLEILIERFIENGACCIFALGWSGEGPILPDNVREELLRQSCRIVNGRVPVLAGVSEQSLPRALKLAKVARDAGASMILATPPYSYPIPQEFVYEYFKSLAADSGVPLIIYQNDEISVKVTSETIERLSETPGVVGSKAYMPFVELIREFRKAHKKGRFFVMSGDEYVFAQSLLMGVEHFTMGGPGNLCLRWCCDIYNSAMGKDWDRVREKQIRMDQVCDRLWSSAESPYMVIKYVLSRMNVCSDRITSPFSVLSAKQRKTVDAALEEYADVLDPPVFTVS